MGDVIAMWALYDCEDSNEVHLYPPDTQLEHVFVGFLCWCNPYPDSVKPNLIHHRRHETDPAGDDVP